MLVIMEPMLPTMVAKISTPSRKSIVTKRYSESCQPIRGEDCGHVTRSPPITAHLLRLRRLADGGEGEGGPVEAVDVLGREGVVALQTSNVRLLK